MTTEVFVANRKIAFMILAHHNIEQVYRLVDALTDINHYVFLHISKVCQSEIDLSKINNPQFVLIKQRYKTAWGGFSVVKATLELLQSALKSDIEFDYFVLLSGQCLPIVSSKEIQLFFQEKNFNYLKYSCVSNDQNTNNYLTKFTHYWFNDALDKFNPYIKKYFHKSFHLLQDILSFHQIFPENFELCHGSQWWAINSEAATYLDSFANDNLSVFEKFKYTWAPDELFFQTVLHNSPLRDTLVNQSLWYIDWNTNGPPKTLTLDDYENIKLSGKLFARKFDLKASRELIAKLDSEIQ